VTQANHAGVNRLHGIGWIKEGTIRQRSPGDVEEIRSEKVIASRATPLVIVRTSVDAVLTAIPQCVVLFSAL
jgi:hypothetical protein